MLTDAVPLICMTPAWPWFEVGVVELYADIALARIAISIIAAIAPVRQVCRLFVVSLFGVLISLFSLGWFMIPLRRPRIWDGIYMSPPGGNRPQRVERDNGGVDAYLG